MATLPPEPNRIREHLVFFLFKRPLIYITLIAGFVFESLINLPYWLLCVMDGMGRDDKKP